jgi:hypothetical protein
MSSLDPKAGNRYLTITGAPVQVLEVREGIIVLQGLASDNRFVVPAGYPLRPFKGEVAAFEARPSPYLGRQVPPRSQAQPKPLAPLIDAMLLVGGHTMRGIVRELKRRASAACRGKDLRANVRARLHWFKKRGYRVDNDSRGCLKAKQSANAAAEKIAPA